MSAARFTPSARTAWHTHAAGQTLYITGGHGLHQPRGGISAVQKADQAAHAQVSKSYSP